MPEDAEASWVLAAGISEVEARFVDPAGNEQRMTWADAARGVCLEESGPVRRFPVRHGRRMAPGWWWSATDGRLVHYASGVMRTQVMRLDHDPHVVAIACRPVELTWYSRDGGQVRHGEISPRLAAGAAVMEAAAVGAVPGPAAPDPVLAANLRWLARYRRPRYRGGELAGRTAEVFRRPRPLIEGVRELGDPVQVFPVVFHALWHGSCPPPSSGPCTSG
ncbi:hypothetical protein ACF064_36810 [Streptomyces sp. NPDC015492]|uniref:hypothetical protein n=1 Tax=Streptomyces sp. NPDC015492 TaxID=3364958 RepID=UPI0036FFA870